VSDYGNSEALNNFKKATTLPLKASILDISELQDTAPAITTKKMQKGKIATRFSPIIQNKTKKHKPALKMAQEMLSKK
jgi:hypothetical protein